MATGVKIGKKWEWGGAFEERFEKALATGFRTDLKIILTNKETKTVLNVHKIFLQLGSSVLDEKIRNADSPAKQRNVNQLIIEIENIDPDIFKTMIKHFYTGKSGANLSQALRLLQLAADFEVKELVEECEKLLNGGIKHENVLPLFEEGMLYAHQTTIKRTIDLICSKGEYFLAIKQFCDLRLECLIEIIKQDELNVVDEMEVFEAVYKWGQAECKRESLDSNDPLVMRKILEKALKYIRFPLMKSEEFVLKVGTKNLLGMEEQMALLMCFLVPLEKRSVLPEGRFISTPRKHQQRQVILMNTDNAILMKSNQLKSYTVSRETESSLIFQQKPIPITENLSLSSPSTTFTLIGIKFDNNCFKFQGACRPQYDHLYSFESIAIDVEMKLRNTSQTIKTTCSPKSSGNYVVINFAKEEWISVKPSDILDFNVSFSGKVFYNTNYYPIHQFLRSVKNYGDYNYWDKGQKSYHVKCEDTNVLFHITKPEGEDINIGFVNAFIVSF